MLPMPSITSEVAQLRTVLLHRPGEEINHVLPSFLEQLLLDDIPYLPSMRQEHDVFSNTLRDQGITVLELNDVVSEALTDPAVCASFIDAMFKNSPFVEHPIYNEIKGYLQRLPRRKMVDKLVAGLRTDDQDLQQMETLSHRMKRRSLFYLEPMANAYFTRDPVSVIHHGVTINHMHYKARVREPLLLDYVFRYHPDYKARDVPIWFESEHVPLEGGDILVLTPEVIAIGAGERTSPVAIEKVADVLFRSTSVRKVLAIDLPSRRAFMHLDTVLTMIDHDKFTVHEDVEEDARDMNVYVLEGHSDGTYRIHHKQGLLVALKEALNLSDIALIPCGGGDPVVAAREQWNDGSNTLAIAPGVVITYDRNHYTNQLLRECGVKVIEIPSSELARGRGGPRCMSMAWERRDL